jgi:hypothetical protein
MQVIFDHALTINPQILFPFMEWLEAVRWQWAISYDDSHYTIVVFFSFGDALLQTISHTEGGSHPRLAIRLPRDWPPSNPGMAARP